MKYVIDFFAALGFVALLATGIVLAYGAWSKVQQRRHINRLLAECRHRKGMRNVP